MCLMIAERRGFSKYATKLPLAIGLLLKSYGYLAWASIVALSLVLVIFFGTYELWSHPLIMYPIAYGGEIGFIRVSLLTLPIGWALCAFVLRKKKQDG